MTDFPMPGDILVATNPSNDTPAGQTPYVVVASDSYTDDIAVCLAIATDAPHFVIIQVMLTDHPPTRSGDFVSAGSIAEVSARAANIGTAVAYYANWGGTVDDVDPYPAQGISIDKLRATRDEMPA